MDGADSTTPKAGPCVIRKTMFIIPRGAGGAEDPVKEKNKKTSSKYLALPMGKN